MIIDRSIRKKLLLDFERPEISILLGARQVGKTFLLKELFNYAIGKGLKARYYNLEIPAHSILFNKGDIELFDMLTHDVDVVFLDEFHYLKNASKLFKAVFDSDKKVKIFASGSSSIEIHKHLKESLAGRRRIYRINPLSYKEFTQQNLVSPFAVYIRFGGLPGLIHYNNHEDKMEMLQDILQTYIQKDIKSLLREENLPAFNHLLYLLAENQGSITVVSNLAQKIGLTSRTTDHYLSVLEYTYTAFSVYSYSRNFGNELKKSRKIYFYDTGIRNAILHDVSILAQRDDKGTLYETFIFLQLVGQLKANTELKFWRTKAGHEIDFILLKNRKPFMVEVKSGLKALDISAQMRIFLKHYPETLGGVVFNENLKGEVEYSGKKIRFLPYDRVIDLVYQI